MSASRTRELGNRSLPAGTLFGAALLAAIIAGLIARFLLESGLSWRCPSIVLFGVPCPSCGTTRALAALAQFDLLAAFRLNPLIVAGLGLALVAPFLKLSRASFERRGGWVFLGVALGLNWIYLFFFLPR